MTTHIDQPPIAHLSQPDLIARLRVALASRIPDQTEWLILRQRRDALVARLLFPDKRTMIAKFWSRPGLTGLLRRLTMTASATREWRTLSRLHRFGVAVPKPISSFHLPATAAPMTEALLMEDLGECELSTECINRLLRLPDPAPFNRFNDDLIDLTERMLRAGIVDPDHGLINTIVPAHGRPVRLDFELARRVPFPNLIPSLYGEMIGRLIATYAFALQPDTTQTLDFASRLASRLHPPRRVLKRAHHLVTQMLRKQFEDCGIDTRIPLEW